MGLFSFLGGLGGLGGGSLGGLGSIGGLLGGHGKTLIDTGTLLGQPDAGQNTPLIDLDIDSAPDAQRQQSAVDLGILPELFGQNVIDADILSGSYGAKGLAVVDVGPDGFGPILTGTILRDPGNPIDLQLLGTPIGGDLLDGLDL